MTNEDAIQQPGDLSGNDARLRRIAWIVSLLVLAAGVAAFVRQSDLGIGVTGKSRAVMWGCYITSFAFWGGASAAGVLLAAAARFSRLPWLRRSAQPSLVTGLFALAAGSVFPIVHLGRPEVFYWLLPFTDARLLYPNLMSPLLADAISLNTAIAADLLFLYLLLLPDLARARDRARGMGRVLARLACPGWSRCAVATSLRARFTPLVGLLAAIATLAVPATISLDFFRTVNPLWNSPLFVPLFLAGSAYSGAAVVVLVLACLQNSSFRPLTPWLVGSGCIWAALTAAECLRVWIGGRAAETAVLRARLMGDFSPLFWIMIALCIIIPAGLMLAGRLQTRLGAALGACGVLCGMWIERFLIVVPTLANPRLSYVRGSYQPTPPEVAIVLASGALFALLWMVFRKWIPQEDGHAPI